MTAADLSISDLVTIAAEAGVFQIMGKTRQRRVLIDYVPARPATILPRATLEDGPLTVYPTDPIELTYVLEDAMLGGVVYAALTCAGHVVIHPFVWESYDKLSQTAIPKR